MRTRINADLVMNVLLYADNQKTLQEQMEIFTRTFLKDNNDS